MPDPDAEPRAEQDYDFTQDYVSWWAPVWEEKLGELRGRPGLRILEIGSFEGRSALWFLEHLMTAPDARILCVDSFVDETEASFDANIRRSGASGKVQKIKSSSDAFFTTTTERDFDFIYIDGDHSARSVLFDGLFAFRLLKPGGLLMFDDYQWFPERPAHARPQVAIDLCLETWSDRCEIVHHDYQVIVRKRDAARSSD